MTAARLLGQLQGVRERGPGAWMACCPGPLHKRGDRRPSLSVRECADGTVLLKCFAGCSAYEVVSMVGLELRDLFPARPTDHHPTPRARSHRPFITVPELVRVLRHDLVVVALAADHLATGQALNTTDRAALMAASEDLTRLLDLAAGR